MSTGGFSANSEHEVLGLERAALARWCHGDPSGFLEICDDEVAYFDPFLPTRVDGISALSAYYDAVRGKISVIAWEVVEPRVVEIGDVAILAFRFRSWGPTGVLVAWNCTEVFRRCPAGWRIAHTHWSFTAPEGAA